MMNCFDGHLSPKAPSSRMTQDPLSYPDIVATRMQSADFLRKKVGKAKMNATNLKLMPFV